MKCVKTKKNTTDGFIFAGYRSELSFGVTTVEGKKGKSGCR